MNRKGVDLTKVVLVTIIAVVGLLLAGATFFKLYGAVVSQEERNAENSLDSIVVKANALEEGASTNVLVRGIQAESGNSEWWYLVGWGKEDPTRPDKCFLKSCVCYCKANSLNSVLRAISASCIINKFDRGTDYHLVFESPPESLKESCQQSGFCRDVDFENVNVVTKWLNNYTDQDPFVPVRLEYFVTEEYPAMVFSSALESLEISIVESNLSIVYDSPYQTETRLTSRSIMSKGFKECRLGGARLE